MKGSGGRALLEIVADPETARNASLHRLSALIFFELLARCLDENASGFGAARAGFAGARRIACARSP